MSLSNSKRIASLVGPTLMAMVAAEFPSVQPHLYDAQIPPIVYLSGVLMFIGGLSVVRFHNHWPLDWSLLVMLSGWMFLLLGLVRMFAATRYGPALATTGAGTFMLLEAVLFAAGAVMTYNGYFRSDR